MQFYVAFTENDYYRWIQVIRKLDFFFGALKYSGKTNLLLSMPYRNHRLGVQDNKRYTRNTSSFVIEYDESAEMI